MSPRFVLGWENVPCVAEVVNRSLKADCTDFICCDGIRELQNVEYADEYQKVFVLFWTLQTYLCDSAHVESFLGPCSKKVAVFCLK